MEIFLLFTLHYTRFLGTCRKSTPFQTLTKLKYLVKIDNCHLQLHIGFIQENKCL